MAKYKFRNPIHKPMVDAFHQWYSKEKALPFIWTIKEIANIDMIYKNLLHLCQATGSSTSDNDILALWMRMLQGLRQANQWVWKNASPSKINSAFNEIVLALRNGKAVPQMPEYTQTKLSIIENMFE